MSERMKMDVVLITYGEPPEASFLDQWRYSSRILKKLTLLVAPIPTILLPWIAAYRGWIRQRTWKRNEYHSPLEQITQRQKEEIQKIFSGMNDGYEWRVHVAYEFRKISVEDFLTSLKTEASQRLFFVPLYVATSDFTTEISQQTFQQIKESTKKNFPPLNVITFRDHLRELANLMARHVHKELERNALSHDRAKNSGLLLGCHGTVVQAPPGISDTGYADTFLLYQYLEEQLARDFNQVKIGWLNHRLGGEWTTPTLRQSAQEMLQDGIQDFVYFPFGFLADNAETQLEGRDILQKIGIQSYIHIPCINEDSKFLQFIAQLVTDEISVYSQCG